MATRLYGDFIVSGGHVHAGDTILNLNIDGELIATANLCRTIDAALSKLPDPPTCLGDIKNDIDELLNAIETIQTCIDENSIHEAAMSTRAQNNLLDLWTACRIHIQTLVDFKAVIEMADSGSVPPPTSPPDIRYAGLRAALRELRIRLNTSIAILHLSTLQSLRLASEQHWSYLRQQVERLQDEYENQTVTRLPKPLPMSEMDLSNFQVPEDPSLKFQRLLRADSMTMRSNEPSMQLSSNCPSSLDQAETYISAIEYFSNTTSKATSFFSTSPGTTRPLQRLLFNRARAMALPEVTALHARTETSSLRNRVRKNLYNPRSAFTALLTVGKQRRPLYEYRHTLLQKAERQRQSESARHRHILRNIVRQAEDSMLPIFASVCTTDMPEVKALKPKEMLQLIEVDIRARDFQPPSQDGDYRLSTKSIGKTLRLRVDQSLPSGNITQPLDVSDLPLLRESKFWLIGSILLADGTFT